MRKAGVTFDQDKNLANTRIVTRTSALLDIIDPAMNLAGCASSHMDYFLLAQGLLNGQYLKAPLPFQTFSHPWTAYHLSRDPSFKCMMIGEAASCFQIPGLQNALVTFFSCSRNQSPLFKIGSRRTAPPNSILPFSKLKIWTSL